VREDVGEEGLPEAMDMGWWLALCRGMNRLREEVWKGVGDVLSGVSLFLFYYFLVVVGVAIVSF